MRRFLVLVVSGLVGAAAAAAWFVWVVHPRLTEARATRTPGDAEWVEMLAMIEACALFYLVLFACGRLGARLVLTPAEHAEIRASGRRMDWRLAWLGLAVFVASRTIQIFGG